VRDVSSKRKEESRADRPSGRSEELYRREARRERRLQRADPERATFGP